MDPTASALVTSLAGSGEDQSHRGRGRGLQSGRTLPSGGVQRDHLGDGGTTELGWAADVQRRQRGQSLLQPVVPERRRQVSQAPTQSVTHARHQCRLALTHSLAHKLKGTIMSSN